MYRTMLKSKIHRATVTYADLDYIGSLTLDADVMEAADLLPGELVHVADITNGARLETYLIEGEPGSGVVGINGAAAHLVQPGDLVIIMAYALVPDEEARELKPRVVHVDSANRPMLKQGGRLRSAAEASDLMPVHPPPTLRVFLGEIGRRIPYIEVVADLKNPRSGWGSFERRDNETM